MRIACRGRPALTCGCLLLLLGHVGAEGQVAAGQDEVLKPLVFDFGRNWQTFLHHTSGFPREHALSLGNRVELAQSQLLADFNIRGSAFQGKRFLDIGCGSGLHSLAAHLLGAKVVSVDLLNSSVSATLALRQQEGVGLVEDLWQVRQGSILKPSDWVRHEDTPEVFDMVYAWGSLHHTGDVWQAVWNAIDRLERGGRLFLALYPKEVGRLDDWMDLKRRYMDAAPLEKRIITYSFIHFGLMDEINKNVVATEHKWRAKHGDDVPLPAYHRFEAVLRQVHMSTQLHVLARGMDMFADAEDWVGGYPTQTVEAADVCKVLKRAGLWALTSPRIVAGMLTVLATNDRAKMPRRLRLPGPFRRSTMGCWHKALPVDWPYGNESPLGMYEDDACLGVAAAGAHEDLPNYCVADGRFEHREGGLFFTASDGSDPNVNGRSYSIAVPDDWDPVDFEAL